MTGWVRLNRIAIIFIAMLVTLGVVISQRPANAFARTTPDRGGYEMRVYLDRTLSITSSRAGDRFVATVADPGPFNLARISGHVDSITPSGLFKGATEMYLSFDRIRFSDGMAYPINAEIVRLYDVRSGQQVDAHDTIDADGHRRPRTLKRTGIGALARGIFGVASGARVGEMAIRPRVAAAGITTGSGSKDVGLDQGVEMLLRVYHE